ANKRRDYFWKLAHQLCDQYDYLFFEDLNLKGMAKLWGRKVHDLAFATFLDILKSVADKKGKLISSVDRWYPSSKTCNNCGHVHKNLQLEDRRWRCPSCLQVNDRDLNAAKNIQRVGMSTLGLGVVSQDLALAIAV
ncbi:MAG: hypothetical protein RLZZ499_874, partial [Cyanobacteriota bacterium]